MRSNPRFVRTAQWLLVAVSLAALAMHTLGNYSFLRMGGRPRFVVDGLTLALTGGVVLGLLLPFVRKLTVGDAGVDFGDALHHAHVTVEAAVGRAVVDDSSIEPLAAVGSELGATGVAASILADLSDSIRGVATANEVPLADVKPPAFLAGELRRRGVLTPELSDAFYATLRPAQTAVVTGQLGDVDARQLRRLAYLVIEELQNIEARQAQEEGARG
jgi:hypothetical protein